jgi:hypothetical protein
MLVKTNKNIAIILSTLNAFLVVLASLGGILFYDVLYEPDPITLPQLIAQDYVTLLLGVPILTAGIILTNRHSTRGWLLLTGGLAYIIYGYFFYVIGVRFNVLFLLYIAIFGSALYALIVLTTNTDIDLLKSQMQVKTRTRLTGGFLIASGLLFVFMWSGRVLASLSSGTILDPVTRQVIVIDMAVLLPALILTGTLLWRKNRWGFALTGLLLVKVATLCFVLVVSSIFSYFWHQPLEMELVVSFTLIALIATILTVSLFMAVDTSQA